MVMVRSIERYSWLVVLIGGNGKDYREEIMVSSIATKVVNGYDYRKMLIVKSIEVW